MSPAPVAPTGLALIDGLATLAHPTIEAYAAASAEYVRAASTVTPGVSKAAQIRLSLALSRVTLADLRAAGAPLRRAVAGERNVGGGLRVVQADVSEMTDTDGLTLAVEIKPVHLAVGRAIWNRFGDIRTFAVNIHLKFPFAVIGGIMTVPTQERRKSGDDVEWKTTVPLVTRAVERFVRAGGRQREGDAPHLLEAIAVVVFDHRTGLIEPDVPPVGSGLRWSDFVEQMATTYMARFE